jgi:hypothetical protein
LKTFFSNVALQNTISVHFSEVADVLRRKCGQGTNLGTGSARARREAANEMPY